MGSPDGYFRFVLSPDGVVTPDFSGSLPGRGGWVTASRQAIQRAVAQNAFARSFKQPATTPADLTDRVEVGLVKAAMNALGMARKTGDVILGFEKVRTALKAKNVAVLIEASDGAEDGKRKLRGVTGDATTIGVFSSGELSGALGRSGVVHAALKNGAAAARFLREARRVEGFRLEPA